MKTVVLVGHQKCGTNFIMECVQDLDDFLLINGGREFNSDMSEKDIFEIKERIENSGRVGFIYHVYGIHLNWVIDILHRIDPNMMAMCIYREPISAMISWHNYIRYSHGKSWGLNTNIRHQQVLPDKFFVDSILNDGMLSKAYQDRFRYDKSASRLRSEFDMFSEFLYEDLKDDGYHHFFQKLYKMCDLGNPPNFDSRIINRSMSYRSELLARIVYKTWHLLTGIDSVELFKFYTEGNMQKSLLWRLMYINEKNRNFLSQKDKDKLKEYFRPMVSDFATITSLDLSRWGYDLEDRNLLATASGRPGVSV